MARIKSDTYRGSELSFPPELKDDLRESGVSESERVEVLATAWEYTRLGIPEYSNPDKYIAFARLTALTTLAEYRGSLIEPETALGPESEILGYDIDAMLDIIFGDGSLREEMGREFWSSIIFMAEKSRERQTPIQHAFAEALALSAPTYFRLRDCDGQFRFFIAAAISCSDNRRRFSEEEYRALTEIGAVMYDAAAFYKHRAEGEIANVFGYCGRDIEFRRAAYGSARAELWALDAQWYGSSSGRAATTFLRNLPLIHMAMRRYRFVEDGLVVGKPETQDVSNQAERNIKLWYRNNASINSRKLSPDDRWWSTEGPHRVLYPELIAALHEVRTGGTCPACIHHAVYGAEARRSFGGVQLCDTCKESWREYVGSMWSRHEQVLPVSNTFVRGLQYSPNP